MADLKALVAALMQPDAYPERPQSVETVETHISHIFLTGDYAYKVKKPVDFGFLDFTTLEKRRHYCQQEVLLNQRLSPDVYLGVVEIREADGRYAIEGPGTTVEYAVKMRQLPRERALTRLLQEGQVSQEDIRGIARLVADFHSRADTTPEIARLGGIEAVRQNTRENFDQTIDQVGAAISREQYDDLKAYTEAFLEVKESLFQERAQGGYIRDCHGDLHSAQIFMENGVSIIDCIEFNERFRYSDVASDIAFLAMDLDYHGRPDLSGVLAQEYVRVSGDVGVWDLLDFYKVYRAYVRGKVEGFRLSDSNLSQQERDNLLERARRYFGLAHYYVEPLRGHALFITAGLVGTGKTHVAAELARRWGLEMISSDVVRKELAGISPTEHRVEAFEGGIYGAEFSARTYDEMLSRARGYISRDKSVILDASFRRAEERLRAAGLAEKMGAYFAALECVAPETVVRERLEERLRREGEASDGRWEIYQQQKTAFEPLTELPEEKQILVDTSHPEGEVIFRLVKDIFRSRLMSR
ncbi:MAG: AAA family ATPase [Chloroflexi bacterium]|nr:AAA family ATPase [Chloroflexota bacterium]